MADGQTSAVAQAAQGLAKAASDGAAAANPMTAMNEGEYTKFFATFKEACAAAGVPFQG